VDEDQWDDDEYDEDVETDDEEPTAPCPYCKREIHEDAVWCPRCGHYISREDSLPPLQPWWIYVGTIVVLYIVYRWIFG
jgi:hypothetical protein